MTQTLTITRGLPASGKSTWSRQQVTDDPKNNVIINKDSLRKMLHDAYWFKDRSTLNITESFVHKSCVSLVRLALEETKNVIVDETNLSDKSYNYWNNLAKEYNVEFIVQDFRDVPLKVCIDRDYRRDKQVGEKVIRDKYNRYIKPLFEDSPEGKQYDINNDINLTKAIICDMDGTLADNSWRNPHDVSHCIDDPIKIQTKEILDYYHNQDYFVIIVSARDEGLAREQTEQWLLNHDIDCEFLFMRKSGDNRRDDIVKHEIFNENIKDKFYIHLVLDDRNRVVDLWRSLGLVCHQVSDGDF